jgi:hypothetical protein
MLRSEDEMHVYTRAPISPFSVRVVNWHWHARGSHLCCMEWAKSLPLHALDVGRISGLGQVVLREHACSHGNFKLDGGFFGAMKPRRRGASLTHLHNCPRLDQVSDELPLLVKSKEAHQKSIMLLVGPAPCVWRWTGTNVWWTRHERGDAVSNRALLVAACCRRRRRPTIQNVSPMRLSSCALPSSPEKGGMSHASALLLLCGTVSSLCPACGGVWEETEQQQKHLQVDNSAQSCAPTHGRPPLPGAPGARLPLPCCISWPGLPPRVCHALGGAPENCLQRVRASTFLSLTCCCRQRVGEHVSGPCGCWQCPAELLCRLSHLLLVVGEKEPLSLS